MHVVPLCLADSSNGAAAGRAGRINVTSLETALEMWLHRGQIRHLHIREMPFTAQAWMVMTFVQIPI